MTYPNVDFFFQKSVHFDLFSSCKYQIDDLYSLYDRKEESLLLLKDFTRKKGVEEFSAVSKSDKNHHFL